MLTYSATKRDKIIFNKLMKAANGDLNLIFFSLKKFSSESKDKKHHTINLEELLNFLEKYRM